MATAYKLFAGFRALFDGVEYRPRRSTQGDALALYFYEDLLSVAQSRNRSGILPVRCKSCQVVVNPKNRTVGISARRGDGTMGEVVHGESAVAEVGFEILRAPNANVHVGAEVKILATAQQRQARRVQSDLSDQVAHFAHRKGSRDPITVAIVAINHAGIFCSRVGRMETTTNGSGSTRHPAQEADAARVIVEEARRDYTEMLVIDYRATNLDPYPFGFVNEAVLAQQYGAMLTRISDEYDVRFR